SKNNGWLSISLYQSSQYVSKIECSLYILDNRNEQQFIQKFNTVLNKSEEYCIPKFLEIIELLENKEKFLPNNDLTIGIELTEFFETVRKITIPRKTQRNQIISDLKDIFESKVGSDVVLLVGDKKILAHKSSVCSNVFPSAQRKQRERNNYS
ncbi:Protein of unknown function, partial [Cotesia congregata]